jgi:hypothetical protein
MRKTRYGKTVIVSVIGNLNSSFRSFETLNPSFVGDCTPCSPDRMESREALWDNILQQMGAGESHCPNGIALVQMVEELLDMPHCGHMYPLDKDWKSILGSYSGQGTGLEELEATQ